MVSNSPLPIRHRSDWPWCGLSTYRILTKEEARSAYWFVSTDLPSPITRSGRARSPGPHQFALFGGEGADVRVGGLGLVGGNDSGDSTSTGGERG